MEELLSKLSDCFDDDFCLINEKKDDYESYINMFHDEIDHGILIDERLPNPPDISFYGRLERICNNEEMNGKNIFDMAKCIIKYKYHMIFDYDDVNYLINIMEKQQKEIEKLKDKILKLEMEKDINELEKEFNKIN